MSERTIDYDCPHCGGRTVVDAQVTPGGVSIREDWCTSCGYVCGETEWPSGVGVGGEDRLSPEELQRRLAQRGIQPDNTSVTEPLTTLHLTSYECEVIIQALRDQLNQHEDCEDDCDADPETARRLIDTILAERAAADPELAGDPYTGDDGPAAVMFEV